MQVSEVELRKCNRENAGQTAACGIGGCPCPRSASWPRSGLSPCRGALAVEGGNSGRPREAALATARNCGSTGACHAVLLAMETCR